MKKEEPKKRAAQYIGPGPCPVQADRMRNMNGLITVDDPQFVVDALLLDRMNWKACEYLPPEETLPESEIKLIESRDSVVERLIENGMVKDEGLPPQSQVTPPAIGPEDLRYLTPKKSGGEA